MKHVVIYYSQTGNNKQLARDLQKRLDCDCVEVREKRRRTRLTTLLDILLDRKPLVSWPGCDFTAYSKAVLVAPIWAGRIATPLASFIAREKDNLPDFAFISLCAGLRGQPCQIAHELMHLTGRTPELVEQLNVNDLLPPEHRNKVRYASAYRASACELLMYESEIEHFLRLLEPGRVVSGTPSQACWHRPAASVLRSPEAPA